VLAGFLMPEPEESKTWAGIFRLFFRRRRVMRNYSGTPDLWPKRSAKTEKSAGFFFGDADKQFILSISANIFAKCRAITIRATHASRATPVCLFLIMELASAVRARAAYC
jgi:hypothetical protein